MKNFPLDIRRITAQFTYRNFQLFLYADRRK